MPGGNEGQFVDPNHAKAVKSVEFLEDARGFGHDLTGAQNLEDIFVASGGGGMDAAVRHVVFVNTSTTETIFYNPRGVADANNFPIPPGASVSLTGQLGILQKIGFFEDAAGTVRVGVLERVLI